MHERLRKLAYKLGATVVLAAPHIDHFIDSLLPTQLVTLRWGGIAEVHQVTLTCRKVRGVLHVKIVNRGSTELKNVRPGRGRSDSSPPAAQSCLPPSRETKRPLWRCARPRRPVGSEGRTSAAIQ